eukprot:TRINITY_DN32060_c0_g1_i1.p2 TRINITY_DN32060_c0_g1~~TRINITY_DN32060_c0_g1_i1.p2  ORF type:complete len:135 (+),score=31.28 TRINITY_DN32060_c0_g1_i1:43-447(+)
MEGEGGKGYWDGGKGKMATNWGGYPGGAWQAMWMNWGFKGKGKGRKKVGDPAKTIWVGSMPAGATWKDLKAHAESAGLTPVWAEVHNNKVGGTGAIGFKTVEDATDAIAKLNGSVFNGASIETDVWTKKPKADS